MMSPDEQARYGEVLRAKETEIRDQLRVNTGSSDTVSLDQEIGRLTRMDALQQQQMALHARRRLETQRLPSSRMAAVTKGGLPARLASPERRATLA